MLIILPVFYGSALLCFSFLIMMAQSSAQEIATHSFIWVMLTRALGYLFYLFAESFGSLVIALFWAFAADTTGPVPAKKGFPLVYAIGQLGGVVLPYGVGGLPY